MSQIGKSLLSALKLKYTSRKLNVQKLHYKFTLQVLSE